MASEQMECLKKIMQQMMAKGLAPTFSGDINPEVLRGVVETAQANMPIEPGVTFTSEKFGDMDAELSVPENAREDAVIIYIHGGGLICGNAKTSRGYASMLAGETRLPCYAFSYRLAPEDPFPAAVDDCFEAYKTIIAKAPGKPIFLIGESGGAYLSIITALKARDNGLQMPAGIIPYSPIIDMSGAIDRNHPKNKDFTIHPEGLDRLTAMYIPEGEDLKNPYISPYYADFKGMCPIFLAWDMTESLAPDSEILMEKAKDAGVLVYGKGYDDCFHAFATTERGTSESADVLKDTVDFIYSHIG